VGKRKERVPGLVMWQSCPNHRGWLVNKRCVFRGYFHIHQAGDGGEVSEERWERWECMECGRRFWGMPEPASQRIEGGS